MSGAWITLNWHKDAAPVNTGFVAFRKKIFVKESPRTAILRIAATPRYRLWINGQYVADGNVRSFSKNKLYDEISILPYLQMGENYIAVVLPDQNGVSGYQVLERIGLFIEGQIKSDHQLVEIQTDATWQARSAEWYHTTSFFYTIPLGKSEHYRGDLEPDGWKLFEDDKVEWSKAFVLGEYGTPPWKRMEKCDLPGFKYKRVEPKLCWAGNMSLNQYDIDQYNLALEFNTQQAKNVKVHDISEQSMVCNEEQNVVTFDVGKTMYAYPSILIKHMKGTIRLEIYYDNHFQHRPTCFTGWEGGNEGAYDTFTPTVHHRKWKSFLPRGFRFITIKMTGEGNCSYSLEVERQEYPYGEGKRLEGHSLFHQQIWDISKETLRCGTTDVIGEPFRENVLWTFDACVGGQAAYVTFGETNMWRHCLRLIAQGIDEDGIPKAVVPSQSSFMVLFDQTFYWVVSCWEYFCVTGDLNLLQEIYLPLRRFFALCKQFMAKDGYFIPPSYAWHWIDWGAMNKEPYALPVNAMLLWSLQAYLKILKTLDKKRDLEQRWEHDFRIRLADFYDSDHAAFTSRIPIEYSVNLNSVNTRCEKKIDLYGNALAYWTKIGTEEQRKNAVRKMVEILKDSVPKSMEDNPDMGIGWVHIILTPLLEEGYIPDIEELLKKYYQPYIQNKATTWGEDFTPNPCNTAHAWGACINILLAQMGE